MTEKDLHALCRKWSNWARIYTGISPVEIGASARDAFGEFVEKNDATLSVNIAFLDLAIAGMEKTKDKEAFLAYYKDRIGSVKQYASANKTSRQSFYKNIKRFRREAYDQSLFLQRICAQQ